MSIKKILGRPTFLLLFMSGGAMAAVGVTDSVHDLSLDSTSSTKVSGSTSDNGQVCVFCHTPHAAADGGTAANLQHIPLWNRDTTTTAFTTAADTIYADNGGGTLSGTVNDLTSGVSLACLSCHDGTISMDSVLNVPGSGNAWGVLTVAGTNVNTTAVADADDGKILNTSVVNLGTDLSNDHPVAIEYGGGNCTANAACVAPTDTAIKTTVLSGTQSWVDMDSNAVFDATVDLIPLFDRTFGATDRPSIECASCHDVHASTTNSSTNGQMLLRVSTDNSGICTACHIK